MATKPAVSGDTATIEQDVETALLDVQSAAVKRLIAKGKERGHVTVDELNAVLPADQNSSEQIEDVMANLSEMGIQVVESEETEDGDAVPVAGTRQKVPAVSQLTVMLRHQNISREKSIAPQCFLLGVHD